MTVCIVTTWKEAISNELEAQGETWDDIESITLSEDELNVEFYAGYGETEGKPFTAWTTRRVYFPVQHDGAESVRSVSRILDGKPTHHISG